MDWRACQATDCPTKPNALDDRMPCVNNTLPTTTRNLALEDPHLARIRRDAATGAEVIENVEKIPQEPGRQGADRVDRDNRIFD